MNTRRQPRNADEASRFIAAKQAAESALAAVIVEHRSAFDGDASGERIFEGTMHLRAEIRDLESKRAYLAKLRLPGE